MENDLLGKIEHIMGVSYFKFDGLPDQITFILNQLMHNYEHSELISLILAR